VTIGRVYGVCGLIRSAARTRVRVYSTGHGNKTDNIDALAIARAAIHSLWVPETALLR
jgi:transposase